MAEQTVFHKILAGEIPADVVYETEDVLGFKDIQPKAETHVLFIPKKPEHAVASLLDVTADTDHVPTMLLRAAQEFAKQHGIDGYKALFNVGKDGGQEVFYLHLHFMSNQAIG